MKTRRTFIGAVMLGLVLGCRHPGVTGSSEVDPGQRIGVYDSRAIAIAYAGSPAHEEKLFELGERRGRALQDGDAGLVAELEEEGRQMQMTAHRQAFSTAPVDDILDHVSGELVQMRNELGLVAVVSKWNAAELAEYPHAERVDVTMALVDAFHPSERQRLSATQIQEHDPIPLDAAGNIRH